MAEACILAIDQGTTGSTVLAFNRHGHAIGRAYSEFPQIYPKPGWVEHDPEVIWQTTSKIIAEAVGPNSVKAIGITNQRETTLIWDRHSGKPIHKAIVWQCRRTTDICRDLKAYASLFRERTGLVVDPYFSGTKIRWLLDMVPGARMKAKNGDLLFGTIDSWLIWKLTDGCEHITDHTNASRTLLYNIHKREWDNRLLDILDIPKDILPKVVDSSGIFATSKRKWLNGVPIAGIAGDQQASLYGLHCHEPGQVKSTYGTGCFIMKYLGEKAAASDHGLLTTLACDVDGKPAYALEGSVFTAAAAVQWLRDGLGIIQKAAETEALANSLSGNGGVYFVPAFNGLGAPYWDPDARGTLVGLTAASGRAHFARATLEAIAYQTRSVLEAMASDSGLPIQTLKTDGGASANNFLLQFQADQLGIPVLRYRDVEKTAFGAALLAGKAIGFWKDLQSESEMDRFQPQVDPNHSDELYQRWQIAVTQARTPTRDH